MSIRDSPRYVYQSANLLPRALCGNFWSHFADFPTGDVSIVDKTSLSAITKCRADIEAYDQNRGVHKNLNRNKGVRFNRINTYPLEIRNAYQDIITGPENPEVKKREQLFYEILQSQSCKTFKLGHPAIYKLLSSGQYKNFKTKIKSDSTKNAIRSLLVYLSPDIDSKYLLDQVHGKIGVYDQLESWMAIHDFARRLSKQLHFNRKKIKQSRETVKIVEQEEQKLMSFPDFLGTEKRLSERLTKANRLYNMLWWSSNRQTIFKDIFFGYTGKIKFSEFVDKCMEVDDSIEELVEAKEFDIDTITEYEKLFNQTKKDFIEDASFKIFCEEFYPTSYDDGVVVVTNSDVAMIKFDRNEDIMYALSEEDLKDVMMLTTEVMSNIISIAVDENLQESSEYKKTMIKIYAACAEANCEESAYTSCHQRDMELLVKEIIFSGQPKFVYPPNDGIPSAAYDIMNNWVFRKPEKAYDRCRELRPLLNYSYNPIFLFNEYARCFRLNKEGEEDAYEGICNGVKYLCARQYRKLTGDLPRSVLENLKRYDYDNFPKEEIENGQFGCNEFWRGVEYEGEGEPFYDYLTTFVKDSSNVPPDTNPFGQNLKDMTKEQRREVLFFSSIDAMNKVQELINDTESGSYDWGAHKNPVALFPKPEQKEGSRTVCMESSYVRHVNSSAQYNAVPIANNYWGSILGRSAAQKCDIMEVLTQIILAIRAKNHHVGIFMVDFLKFGHTIPLKLTKRVQEVMGSYYGLKWVSKYIDHLIPAEFFSECCNLKAIIANPNHADGQGLRNGTWQVMLAAAPFGLLSENKVLRAIMPKDEQISAVFFQDDHTFVVPYSMKKLKKSWKTLEGEIGKIQTNTQETVVKVDEETIMKVDRMIKKRRKEIQADQIHERKQIQPERFNHIKKAVEKLIIDTTDKSRDNIRKKVKTYLIANCSDNEELIYFKKAFDIGKLTDELNVEWSYTMREEPKVISSKIRLSVEEQKRFDEYDDEEKAIYIKKISKHKQYMNDLRDYAKTIVTNRDILAMYQFEKDEPASTVAWAMGSFGERGIERIKNNKLTYSMLCKIKAFVMPIIERCYKAPGLQIESAKTSIGFEAFSLLSDIYDTKGLVPTRSKAMQTMLRPSKQRAPSLENIIRDLWTVLGSACLSGLHPNQVWTCGLFALPLKIHMFLNMEGGTHLKDMLLCHFIPSELGGIPFGLPKHLTPGLTFFRSIDFKFIMWYHHTNKTIFGPFVDQVLNNVIETRNDHMTLKVKFPKQSFAYKELIDIMDENFGMKIKDGIKERNRMLQELLDTLDIIPPTLRLHLKDLHPVSQKIKTIEKMCLSVTARELLGVERMYQLRQKEISTGIIYYRKIIRMVLDNKPPFATFKWHAFLKKTTPTKMHIPYEYPTHFFLEETTADVMLHSHYFVITPTQIVRAPKYTAYGQAYPQCIDMSPFRPNGEFKRTVDVQELSFALSVAFKEDSFPFLAWLEKYSDVLVEPLQWGAVGAPRILRDLQGIAYNSQVLAPWCARLTHDKRTFFTDLEELQMKENVIVNYGAMEVLAILRACDSPHTKLDGTKYFRLLKGVAWKECDFTPKKNVVSLPPWPPVPIYRPVTSEFAKLKNKLLIAKSKQPTTIRTRERTEYERQMIIEQEFEKIITERYKRGPEHLVKGTELENFTKDDAQRLLIKESGSFMEMSQIRPELLNFVEKSSLSKMAWKMWGEYIVKQQHHAQTIELVKCLPLVSGQSESTFELFDAVFEQIKPISEDYDWFFAVLKKLDCENSFLNWLTRMWRSRIKGPLPVKKLTIDEFLPMVMKKWPQMYFKLVNMSIPLLKNETIDRLSYRGKLAYLKAWSAIYHSNSKEIGFLMKIFTDKRSKEEKAKENPILVNSYVGLIVARMLTTAFTILHAEHQKNKNFTITENFLRMLSKYVKNAMLLRYADKYNLGSAILVNAYQALSKLEQINKSLKEAIPIAVKTFKVKFARLAIDLDMNIDLPTTEEDKKLVRLTKVVYENVVKNSKLRLTGDIKKYMKNSKMYKTKIRNSFDLLSNLGASDNLMLSLSRMPKPENEEKKTDKSLIEKSRIARNKKIFDSSRDREKQQNRVFSQLDAEFNDILPKRANQILGRITLENVLSYVDELTGNIYPPEKLFSSTNLTMTEKDIEERYKERYYNKVKDLLSMNEEELNLTQLKEETEKEIEGDEFEEERLFEEEVLESEKYYNYEDELLEYNIVEDVTATPEYWQQQEESQSNAQPKVKSSFEQEMAQQKEVHIAVDNDNVALLQTLFNGIEDMIKNRIDENKALGIESDIFECMDLCDEAIANFNDVVKELPGYGFIPFTSASARIHIKMLFAKHTTEALPKLKSPSAKEEEKRAKPFTTAQEKETKKVPIVQNVVVTEVTTEMPASFAIVEKRVEVKEKTEDKIEEKEGKIVTEEEEGEKEGEEGEEEEESDEESEEEEEDIFAIKSSAQLIAKIHDSDSDEE